jgi:hypothetical protein
MTEVAVSWLVLLRNTGAGSQLTLLKGTLTVTVTGCPYPAEVGSDGLIVTVAPEIPAFAK